MESKILNERQIEKMKENAEKVAVGFGYTENSDHLDVVNVKDAYCIGYKVCYKEYLTALNAHDELVKALELAILCSNFKAAKRDYGDNDPNHWTNRIESTLKKLKSLTNEQSKV